MCLFGVGEIIWCLIFLCPQKGFFDLRISVGQLIYLGYLKSWSDYFWGG